jgi:hypothetical protein
MDLDSPSTMQQLVRNLLAHCASTKLRIENISLIAETFYRGDFDNNAIFVYTHELPLAPTALGDNKNNGISAARAKR